MKIMSILSALVLISCHSNERKTSSEEQPPTKPETALPEPEAKTPDLVTYPKSSDGESSASGSSRKPSALSVSISKFIGDKDSSPTSIPLPTPQPRVPSTPQGEPAPPEYQTAKRVSGRVGYVFNPSTNEEVDVRGIPKGSLIRDPKYSIKDHKSRVPE